MKCNELTELRDYSSKTAVVACGLFTPPLKVDLDELGWSVRRGSDRSNTHKAQKVRMNYGGSIYKQYNKK